MINNITVPEYKEILPMICLDDSHHLNGNVVDDASLEVMLRIEKEMQRLKVMGSDERRTLWLEIHLPGRGYQYNVPLSLDRSKSRLSQICSDTYTIEIEYLCLVDNTKGTVADDALL